VVVGWNYSAGERLIGYRVNQQPGERAERLYANPNRFEIYEVLGRELL
jgi:hypothetical protein